MDTATLSVNKPIGHERETPMTTFGIATMLQNGALANEFETKLTTLLKQKEEIDATIDELKAKLIEVCEANGVTKIEGEKLTISYVAGSTSRTFDSASFKLKHPKLYESFKKDTDRKASVRISAKL